MVWLPAGASVLTVTDAETRSRTGVSSGDREAGLTVGLADDMMRSPTRLDEGSGPALSSFWEPKSCWDSVMGLSRSESSGDEERITTPESRRKRLSSSTSIRFAFCAFRSSVSSSLFRTSSASTSSLLRSRDDCAARRLRRTRSTRRCSFSSSVFARFLQGQVVNDGGGRGENESEAHLGGRFVLGSGRTWPHDLRFLEAFFSAVATWASGWGCGSVSGAEGAWSSTGDSGVIMSAGLTVAAEGDEEVACGKREARPPCGSDGASSLTVGEGCSSDMVEEICVSGRRREMTLGGARAVEAASNVGGRHGGGRGVSQRAEWIPERVWWKDSVASDGAGLEGAAEGGPRAVFI